MGISYDTWRTTPPDDLPGRKPRFCPDAVEYPLCIEAGEVQIDGTGVYSTETAALLSVLINDQHHTPEAVKAMLDTFAPGGVDRWLDPLDTTTLGDLVDSHAASMEEW